MVRYHGPVLSWQQGLMNRDGRITGFAKEGGRWYLSRCVPIGEVGVREFFLSVKNYLDALNDLG